MTEPGNKIVLLITNSYPPCRLWTSASRRMEGFARYLPEMGWKVIVLNHQCACRSDLGVQEGEEVFLDAKMLSDRAKVADSIKKISQLIQREEVKRVIIRYRANPKRLHAVFLYFSRKTGAPIMGGHLQPKPQWYLNMKAQTFVWPIKVIFTLIRKGLSLGGYGFTDDGADWTRSGSKFAARLLRELRIPMLLSTAPYMQNHKLAYQTSRMVRVCWIADMRDSACRLHDVEWLTKKPPLWSEKRKPPLMKWFFLRRAQLVLHVNDDEYQRDRGLLGETPHTVIENGFLEEEMRKAHDQNFSSLKTTPFVFRYLGHAVWLIPLDSFFLGLKLFTQNQKVDSEHIRFEYYGNYAMQTIKRAEELGVSHLVRAFPSITKEEVYRKMTSSTALVLPLDSTYPGVPGAKFYEYIGATRPILAIGSVERERYIGQILYKTGCGVLADSPEQIEQILKKWYAEYRENPKWNLPICRAEVFKYSRRAHVLKLQTLLENKFRSW